MNFAARPATVIRDETAPPREIGRFQDRYGSSVQPIRPLACAGVDG